MAERQEENHRERWPRNQVKKVLQERGSEMSRAEKRTGGLTVEACNVESLVPL